MSHVVKRDGHWFWTGSTDSFGNGIFYAVGNKFEADRVSWLIANERVPKGLHISPSCGADGCIAPEHLSSKQVDVGTSLYDG